MRISRDHHQPRVAIRLRTGDSGIAALPAGARPVLDDHRRPEPLLQAVRNGTRGAVALTAGWERNDDLDGPARPGALRAPDAAAPRTLAEIPSMTRCDPCFPPSSFLLAGKYDSRFRSGKLGRRSRRAYFP
jgi:hypothetical protein